MKKIGIVSDSTFSLQDSIIKELDIKIVNLNIIVDQVVFTDGIDISCDDVFDAIDAKKKVTTSQPSPEAFSKAYDYFIDQGITDILCFTVSSGLSGTYSSANLANQIVDGKANIKVVDTKSSAMAGELLIVEVGELIKQGVDFEKVCLLADELVEKTSTILTIDDLDVLFKSGRLTRAKTLIGSLMKVKIIMELDKAGKIFVAGKVRSTKKIFEFIVKRMEKKAHLKDLLHIRISYISTKENAFKLKEQIEKRFTNAKIYICKEITPVLSVHLGKGGFGLSWLTK